MKGVRNATSDPGLDADALYQAWKARDRRYDGKVFTGVKTTGIFCRPVCPARTPLKKNMVFFRSAAAAHAAGFRPCLRCRPEAAPNTPAWKGSVTTVSRALKLISSGWAEEHGLEALASRLGLGQRQIRRLFEKHLGSSPLKVLRSRQLDSARKALETSGTRIQDIALASGFSSVRRFNDAFKARFHLTPTEARRSKNARKKTRH